MHLSPSIQLSVQPEGAPRPPSDRREKLSERYAPHAGGLDPPTRIRASPDYVGRRPIEARPTPSFANHVRRARPVRMRDIRLHIDVAGSAESI